MTTPANTTASTTAIAANKLLVNPQTGVLGIAPNPTGGQGLALDPRGKIPLAVRKLLPGYLIASDQITNNVTVSSAVEATGTTVIACAAHLFDGEPLNVELTLPVVQPAAGSGTFMIISLFEGSTQVARMGAVIDPGTTSLAVPFYSTLQFTPTRGYHTYTVTAFQSGGNGTIFAGAGGTNIYVPGIIRFIKL